MLHLVVEMSWIKYHHTIISNFPPHYEIQKKDIEIAKRMMKENKALLVRYTSNFDCKCETEWWYLIKDMPDDVNNLKSKDKYEIIKGIKRNTARQIDPQKYKNELYNVYYKAFSRYKKNDVPIRKEKFIEGLIIDKNNPGIEYFGVFSNKNRELVGYSKNILNDDYVSYSTIKFNPNYLSDGCSTALFYAMNNYYLVELKKKYVLDGERSIRHETNIQEYLEKYFKFRRAYCKLNIIYNPLFEIVIKILYPFEHFFLILNKYINSKIINNVYSMLYQEKIRRKCL